MALIIFISTITGAIIVALLGIQKEFILSRGNRRLTKDAKNSQMEIETFKNENIDLKFENETLKNKLEDLQIKTQDLETKIVSLETDNKILNVEANELNIEITKLKTENSILQ